MNQTEINTLLANGVEAQTIVIASAAGKIQGAIQQARRSVDLASNDRDGINWKEMFRYFEAQERKMGKAQRSKDHGR